MQIFPIGVLLPMNLSPVKYEILKTMLLLEKPKRAIDIAKEVGRGFPSVMMHIIGLARMGYIVSPEKGLYTLTEKSRRSLGIPEVGRENAIEILAYLPLEKAFHFFSNVGTPLDLHAHGLEDFYNKILRVDIDSLEFHKNRGDFQAWFKGLGDFELAKKVALLEEKDLEGEEYRKRLHNIVKTRFGALTAKLSL
jgi:hypothetical protein